MPSLNKGYRRYYLLLEAFVIINIGFLSLDIYLAHSINRFHHDAEYIPLWFSLISAPLFDLSERLALLDKTFSLSALDSCGEKALTQPSHFRCRYCESS